MMEASATTAISVQCSICSRSFDRLCDIARNTPAVFLSRNDTTESLVHDEVGRFRVWLGNVGAHRLGRVSLDYRLRDAVHMRESVLELLKDLEDNIHEGWFQYFWCLRRFDRIANNYQLSMRLRTPLLRTL